MTQLRMIPLLALALLLLGSPARAAQVQSFNCDFDDNIFVTDAHIFVWDETNKKEVGVSTAEWALVKNKIGKEAPWKAFTLRTDALREFGDDGPRGAGELKQQVVTAIGKKGDGWKGPSWDAFVSGLSHDDTRAHVTIISARLHSPEAMLAALRELKDRGLLPALPPVENLYGVGWPGLATELKGKDAAESKSKVMMKRLDEIEARPIPKDAFEVADRAGTAKAKLHLWGFSDDDFGNFAKAREVLAPQVARGRWPHVKIVLYFTGRNDPREKARAVVLMPNGAVRPAQAVEARSPWR